MVNKIISIFAGSGPQLLAAIAGTINAVSDGMQFGWTSPSLPILSSPDSPVPITDSDKVWLESLYMVGGLVGLPFSIILVDTIGRKKTVLMSSVVGLVGWILIGIGTNVYQLFLGRFLLGITADIAFNASPMYISEIAHQKIRGFLSGIIYLMMLIGIVIIYTIGPLISIRASAIAGGSLLFSQFIIFPFMPESPYYLIYRDKYDTAKRALERLRSEKDVSKELIDIQAAVERQKTERGKPQDLFLVKSNRKACNIATLLNSTQHFVGITILIMNVQDVLEQAGVGGASYSAILFSVLMLISATVSSFIVDMYGRKILLLLSGVITSVCLLIIAAYFHVQASGVDISNFTWIPMLMVMVYAVSFKLGLGMVPIVMTAELFPTKVRAWGMAMSDTVYVVASTISIYLYDWLASYGMHYPFYLFGIWCIASTVVMSVYIPETKGKTLEEIQMILKN